MTTGVIVFAHGSSVADANDAVRAVSERLRAEGSFALVETAFLEIAHPDLAEAVAALVSRGARSIVVVPYFLTMGIHLKEDLPRIVAGIAGIYNGVKIDVTAPLDGHPALFLAVLERARQAVAGNGDSPERQVG